MFARTEEYKKCDTIYYPGANSTQTQALQYVGNQHIKATTGEIIWSTGKNHLKPLNVIFNLHIGPEIADVNLQPYLTYYDCFNPFKLAYTSVQWAKNYFNGVHVQPAENPTPESVVFHSPNMAKMSYGQESDIESHYKKYLHWKEHKINDDLILYGVSRGTAATFCALATYQYPEVKLVVLEGAIDSMENVLTNLARKWLYHDTIANYALEGAHSVAACLTRNGLFGYERGGVSPLSLVEKFPEHVPVIFVTSAKDSVVSPENTKNIAAALSRRGKNDVYLLELKNSSHPSYMYDDKQDHDQYEAVINAIYKKYGLQHDEELAANGEHLVERCCLSIDNTNLSLRL